MSGSLDSWSSDVTVGEVTDLDDGVQTKAMVANVLLGTGAVAAAVGVVLFLLRDDAAGETATVLSIRPGRHGVVLGVGGTL